MRILRGAELAQADYAPLVLVDGMPTLVGNESDMTIQYAGQKGFPASMFTPVKLPGGVRSTISEARYVGGLLKKRGITNILLVTSNFHTRRAAGDFRRENHWLHVTVVAAPDPYFTPDGWWNNREGRKTFGLEWLKTFATWFGV